MPKNTGHDGSSKIMPGGFKLCPFFDLGHKKCPLGNHDWRLRNISDTRKGGRGMGTEARIIELRRGEGTKKKLREAGFFFEKREVGVRHTPRIRNKKGGLGGKRVFLAGEGRR